MSSTKRMVYQMLMPDIAVGPGPVPLGSIEGRGTSVPAVDCPMPRNGNRSPLSVCFECSKLENIGPSHIVCGYEASAQDIAEIQRRMNQPPQAPQPHGPQQQGAPIGQHPGVQPPVPPNVFNPKK